jgi:hypothetical protein
MKKKESPKELDAGMINREQDVAYVFECVQDAECCSVVGVSNIGKSTVMRALSLPVVHERYLGATAHSHMFVYVDFNLISQMTEQGFYEVILRNVLELLDARQGGSELRSAIRQGYEKVIASDSPFLFPLAFEDSLEALVDHQPGMLVLLFDEFDEVFVDIEPRVFVRLRALKDRHWSRLCYVTATGHPLAEIRRGRQVGEFCELFAAHTDHMAPLAEGDARTLVQRWAMEADVDFTAKDIDFVLECAGGHPALLQATCRVLAEAKEEALWRPAAAGYERVREELDSDANVRLECAKLWNDLSTQEQETLILLLTGQDFVSGLDSLTDKGMIDIPAESRARLTDVEAASQPAGEAAIDLPGAADEVQVFAGLFAGFVRRQRLVRRRGARGVRVDVEAGDVWVDGELAPTLTELEYKLLLLLYGNLEKICDKYKIVESVWGEDYIDEVDDARIEKLVSRLRHKIEPNPEEPRYLITVRGRGYKLASPD